jgi:hypothetical protein
MKDWISIDVLFADGERIVINKDQYIRMIKVAAVMEDMEQLKNIARVFMSEEGTKKK